MRLTLVLIGFSLKRIRGVLIGLGLLMAAFEFMLTQVAAFMVTRSAFGALAQFMPDWMGAEALAFASFSGIVSLGYFHPLVIGSMVGLAITIATEPAAEVERRFVDLTLARPLTRSLFVARTIVVLFVMMAFMLALMTTGTWVGLTCCIPAGSVRPSFTQIASLAASLAALTICWAGVALALAATARRRAVAGTVAGVLALATYLLDYLGRAWAPAEPFTVVSPFRYVDSMGLINGAPLSVSNLTLLSGVGLVGIIVGWVTFARRDI